MMVRRVDGDVHPGFRWGPFTFRVPFYHLRFELPEFLQGLLLSAATGLALVPIMQNSFGLAFEEAVTMAFLHAALVSCAPILFGEPFATGWITPALPLVLAFIVSERFPTEAERFQMMTALALDFSAILIILGLTGMGRLFIEWIPVALKGAIIMGAAIAAMKRVFLDDAPRYLHVQPVSTILALGVCLILIFSQPIQKYKMQWPWLRRVASLGLLPGFVTAAVVGALPFVGEIKYEVLWGDNYGFLVPPFASLWEKVSPFAIGFPPLTMFVQALPLAFIGYIILFGDIITGVEVIKGAQDKRPDERIDFNSTRTHLSTGIRNLLMGLFAPFFPTQGILWTGVHVIITQRWAEGRKAMDSIYSGISSYYFFGVPILYLTLPLVTGLRPLLGIALSLTLVLTGFACAYIAMEIPRNQTERGIVLLGGVALAIFEPHWGLLVAIAATFLLLGRPSQHAGAAQA